MSSIAQIEANRINSFSSTGPRTPEGKQISSRNSVSHGLSSIGDPVLPHEDRNEFGVVNRSYFYDFSPATAHEGYLVNEMAGARWRMARADRLLNIVLSGRLEEPAENDAGDPELRIARAMAAKGDPIAKLERHRAAWERTYYRCIRELRAAQKFRLTHPVDAVADPEQQNEPVARQSGDAKTYKRQAPKIGRNDYCPCNSGLKYKKCCLQRASGYAPGALTPIPATAL